MQVETYEEQEVAEAACEDIEAAKHLVASLGLKGQEHLYTSDAPKVFPYRRVTNQELFVYKQLFPRCSKIEEFKSGAIPLRVLQVASHAKESFIGTCQLYVWHTDDVRKDPILVLQSVDPERTWEKVDYLLARWGDALEEFAVLAERARKVWADKSRAELLTIKAKVDAMVGNVDALAEKYFHAGEIKTYSFYD